jgi:hypothetical protein
VNPMNEHSRINAKDRRAVAIHEAGHCVIARWAGVRDASAVIFRNPTDDPRQEHTWIGRAFIKRSRLSILRHTMIAVAGRVAEEIWNKTDPVDVVDFSDLWYDANVMSPADWAMAYCLPGQPDCAMLRAVGKSYELLSGELKADLYATARHLMRACND